MYSLIPELLIYENEEFLNNFNTNWIIFHNIWYNIKRCFSNKTVI